MFLRKKHINILHDLLDKLMFQLIMAYKDHYSTEIDVISDYNLSMQSEYKMEDYYNLNDLVISKLAILKKEGCKKTKIKYIFKKVIIDDNVMYQEIFTGFVFKRNVIDNLNMPFLTNEETFSDFGYEMNQLIHKNCMLFLINEINKMPEKRMSYKN